MNVLHWLKEQAKGYNCSVCGTSHERSEIRALGKIEFAWIVRVTCSQCQTAFKLLVVVGEENAAASSVAQDRPQQRPAISLDEVIDAHEALKDFRGDVKVLFGRRRPREAAKTEGLRRV